jgi:hypothetical protein
MAFLCRQQLSPTTDKGMVGIPTKPLSVHKVVFDEAEVDTWISRRNEGIAKVNVARYKVLAAQRKERRKAKKAAAQGENIAAANPPEVKVFKPKEA